MMDRVCETCGKVPASTSFGGRRLCTACAQKRTMTSALPFVGAALAAAGLIAGSAFLAEKMQGESKAVAARRARPAISGRHSDAGCLLP